MRELLLRRKEHRGVVVTPRSVVLQWKGEMESRFGLSFAVMVRQYISEMRLPGNQTPVLIRSTFHI